MIISSICVHLNNFPFSTVGAKWSSGKWMLITERGNTISWFPLSALVCADQSERHYESFDSVQSARSSRQWSGAAPTLPMWNVCFHDVALNHQLFIMSAHSSVCMDFMMFPIPQRLKLTAYFSSCKDILKSEPAGWMELTLTTTERMQIREKWEKISTTAKTEWLLIWMPSNCPCMNLMLNFLFTLLQFHSNSVFA